MKITKALIERFLNDECDEWERQVIKEYLMQHPEVLQKHLTEQSWITFDASKTLSTVVSEKMLYAIRNQAYNNKKMSLIPYKWMAAAAVLIMLLGAFWYTQHNNKPAPVIVARKTVESKQAPYTWQCRNNSTEKTVSFSLSDGSRIELAPHSTIRYAEPFMNNRRDIYLHGQALFRVAHDSTKPFTVYAGKLATTALGTVFRITAFDEDAATRVHLLSGKVVVEPDSVLKVQGVKHAYLTPGQELRFDPLKQVVVVSRKDKPNKYIGPVIAKHKTTDTANALLTFHNEPIENIFNTLSERYHVKFSFPEKLLAGMSFTGKFDNSKESLFDFIQTISLLNNLTVRQEDGVIYLASQ